MWNDILWSCTLFLNSTLKLNAKSPVASSSPLFKPSEADMPVVGVAASTGGCGCWAHPLQTLKHHETYKAATDRKCSNNRMPWACWDNRRSWHTAPQWKGKEKPWCCECSHESTSPEPMCYGTQLPGWRIARHPRKPRVLRLRCRRLPKERSKPKFLLVPKLLLIPCIRIALPTYTYIRIYIYTYIIIHNMIKKYKSAKATFHQQPSISQRCKIRDLFKCLTAFSSLSLQAPWPMWNRLAWNSLPMLATKCPWLGTTVIVGWTVPRPNNLLGCWE